MKVMVLVKTSSLIIFLNHKEPAKPINKPKIGPPPAILTRLTVIPTGEGSAVLFFLAN